jgi:glycosyltransferase involved in cell wall biosynthesis
MNNALTREAGAGGPVFSNNVMRRLPKHMEVVYLPSSLTIAKIESDEEALRLANALEGLRETGLWIPERVVEFLEGRAARLGRRDRVMAYLDLMAKEAKGADFFLDTDYWPHNMANIRQMLGSPASLLLGDVFYLTRRIGGRALAVVQGLGIKPTNPPGISVIDYIRSVVNLRNVNATSAAQWFAYDVSAAIHARILMRKEFAKIFFVSAGQMVNLRLRRCGKCEVLRPALAVDSSNCRRAASKENIFTYAGRRVTNKGILELPYIYAEAAKRTGAGLVVAGRFNDGTTERAFVREVRRLGLDSVRLTGWLSKAEFYGLLSRAKVLLYPSHSDSFSIVVLESLACGTPVVAYDIPGLRSVYGDLPAVRFVKEFDRRAMAEEAVSLAMLGDDEYSAVVRNERVLSFLKEHSSWDVVAERFAERIIALSRK